jgi:hypothetical protein
MSFEGSILARLHSYGLVDSETTTEDAAGSLNKKKAILVRRSCGKIYCR